MDWIYIERKYEELKSDYDLALDAWAAHPSDELWGEMDVAKSRYLIFCSDILEQLMENHQDILQRLKKWGWQNPSSML